MIDTIFVGLSGLQTFQKGLSNIGNNLANLNTPGFKRTALQFTDQMYQYESQSGAAGFKGDGVTVGTSTTDFVQGQLQSSTNPLDVSIDGDGFFVSKLGSQMRYSRAGQFELTQDGALVSRIDQSRVQVSDGANGLRDFSVAALRNQVAKPTAKVEFADNLSSGAQNSSVDATVYDQDGLQRQLKATFTNNESVTPHSWKVELQDKSSQAIIGNGEIRFNADGSPAAGFNEVELTLKAASGGTSTLKLYFGQAGSLSGTTNLSGGSTSTIRVASQDGYAAGSMTKLSFDSDGNAVINYSNGQSATGSRLALAWFAQPDHQLQRLGAGMFQAIDPDAAVIGKAGAGVFGKVVGSKLELSNVEISTEFSEMIITQRGYQAASQLISAANEMMQQALQMKGSR